MGAIEDLRKVLQDVVTPEIKALGERVTALEQKLDIKTSALEQKLDLKFEFLDKKIDQKSELLMLEIRNLAATVAANQISIMHALDIDRRVERIENTIAAKTN